MKKIEESDDADPDLSPLALQPKIGQDLQPETDFAATENRQNGDGDAEEEGQSIIMMHRNVIMMTLTASLDGMSRYPQHATQNFQEMGLAYLLIMLTLGHY